MNRSLPAILLALPLFAAACGDDTTGDDVPDEARAVVVAGDFNATGIVSTVGAPAGHVVTGAVDGVASSDPTVRRIGDELFVINRFGGDNVTVLDAATLELVDQYATGAGSNPQDVAVVGSKLYVAALGTGSVIVIDRADDGAMTEIDISALDDDGVPDCTSVIAQGNKVYVACGLLDAFFPVEDGVLVVIDSSNDLFDTVTMPDQNPVGWFIEQGNDLLITLQPSFSSTDSGCLARVITGATTTVECGPSSADLDGFVTRAVVVDDLLLATVMKYAEDFTSTSKLVWIDGATISESQTPGTMSPQDLAVCGDHVFVADKAADAEGIRIFGLADTTLTEETTAALDVGLPPIGGGGIACIDL